MDRKAGNLESGELEVAVPLSRQQKMAASMSFLMLCPSLGYSASSQCPLLFKTQPSFNTWFRDQPLPTVASDCP